MELEPGAVVDHYRLVSKIGEGGMGVVWKAVDTTLGRTVALKFLPRALAADAERIARFDREARVLASLNHPGIAAIYGFESAGDARFLVMELAEGETLASRIARGPMPVPEALAFGLQVAAALEAAHERGIVHRDLKPQNVQVDTDGVVKLLDFGLARAFTAETASGPVSIEDSPTISALVTSPAVILGTAAYMSPEQARGRPVDRRADIWAFGVVLFEALTGSRLFAGETVSDTIASVLRHEIPWSDLPANLPPAARALLVRCLERDPRQRLRDIGEARIAIERAQRDPAAASATSPAPAAAAGRPDRRILAASVAAALVAGAVLAWAALRGAAVPTREAPPRRFALVNPTGHLRLSPVISPDGTMAAYLSDGRIWLQPLDQLDPRDLADGKGVTKLFWSPDSKWIGTLADAQIGKLPVSGGPLQVVARTGTTFPGGGGAAWGEGGTIVASHAQSDGIFEVSEGGGDPRTLVLPDSTTEWDFHDPSLLPGERGILVATHAPEGVHSITLIEGSRRTTLLSQPGIVLGSPIYSPTGHILFIRHTTPVGLWALPFALDGKRVTGAPFQLAEHASDPSVSADGTLLYLERRSSDLQFVWVDRAGTVLDTLGAPTADLQGTFDLAPDGDRVIASMASATGMDLWLFDGRRGTQNRLWVDPWSEASPTWTADGTHVTYQAAPRLPPAKPSDWIALMRPIDGSAPADTLAVGGLVNPVLSPDGRQVIFAVVPGGGAPGLRLASLRGDRASIPLPVRTGAPYAPRPSPDGRLLAYVVGGPDFSGSEIFVRRFPTGEGEWQVSSGGGLWPRWNARGDRLYFIQGEDVVEVSVGPGDPPEFGRPTRLFTRAPVSIPLPFNWTPHFGVHGDRFLILQPARRAGTESIVAWQNWSASFRKSR